MAHQRVSTLNSSSTTLGASETFTGEWEAVGNYISLNVSINSTSASIPQTSLIVVEHSADGSNVGSREQKSIRGNANMAMFPIVAGYVRIIFRNGVTALTTTTIITTMLSRVDADTAESAATSVQTTLPIPVEIKDGNQEETIVLELQPTNFPTEEQRRRWDQNGSSPTFTVAITNNNYISLTGDSGGGKSIFQTRRFAHLNAGCKAKANFGASFGAFSTVTDSDHQGFVGVMSSSNGLTFGYTGSDFGITRWRDGQNHVDTIQITGVASSSDDLTINTNSIGNVTVAVLTSDSVIQIATKITNAFQGTTRAWLVHNNGDTVYFTEFFRETRAAAALVTFGAGTTGVTATVTNRVQGNAPTFTTVLQSSWNIDALDGTGASSMVLDPTSFNEYEIDFYSNSQGAVFKVLDPTSGKYVAVHKDYWSNENNTPYLSDSNAALGIWLDNDTSSPVTSIIALGPSNISQFGRKLTSKIYSAYGVLSSVTTTLKQFLVLGNRETNSNYQTQNRALVIKRINVATSASALVPPLSVVVTLTGTQVYSPVIASAPSDWSYVDNTSIAGVAASTRPTVALPGILTFPVNQWAAKTFTGQELYVAPNERLTIAGRTASSTVEFATVTIEWEEV